MPDKIMRATVYSVCFGQQLRTVMHFRRRNFTTADLGGLAVQIRERYVSQARFLSCGGLQYYNIRVEVPNDDSLNPIDLPINSFGGAGNNNAVSLLLCGVLNIKTADTSKRGKGRIYIPAVKLEGLQEGLWGFGQFQAMNSVAASIAGQFAAENPPTGYSLGVTNKIEPQVAFKEMLDVIPRLWPGSQVRRQFKRGS